MEFPTKKKCVHTVALDGWRPDILAITIPNLQRFAKRIDADFNVITKPKYPDYPPSYERLQVWEAGREYMWNICLDADIILHQNFDDPTSWLSQDSCGSMCMLDAKTWFKSNKYFERDGRGIGVADCFVVSNWLTHDIWTPLGMPFNEAVDNVKDKWMISEYCLSLNVARYGLKYGGVVNDFSKIFHTMDKTVSSFQRTLAEWGE